MYFKLYVAIFLLILDVSMLCIHFRHAKKSTNNLAVECAAKLLHYP